MYKIKSIGSIKVTDDETEIEVDKKYRKALKYVDEFSYIHVFYLVKLNQKYEVKREIVEIKEVNLNQGCIKTSMMEQLENTAGLVDIKPYFPSEDTVGIEVYSDKRERNSIQAEFVQSSGTEELSCEINSIGKIRNVNGKIYIQLDRMIDFDSKYITIFWWFDKFDSDKFRGVTECNPPYENAPRSGIFATRSPLRPNPIAMTVTRVLEVDKENMRIYLNNIESFDGTPCIGISEYDSKRDCVKECKVPSWLMHWPKQIEDTAIHNKETTMKIKDSGLYKLINENRTNIEKNEKADSHEKQELKKPTEIIVRGARENNLQGLNVKIPYGKITAVVGVSGCGKSSLVNQTIYAECRRRMEYLSNSHNAFQKPMVDDITGCIPAVVITQDAIRGNTFSTVGTYSDAYDYLRSIFAGVAVRHCPDCGNEIIPLTKERINNVLINQEDINIYNFSNKPIKEESLEQTVDRALEDGEGAFYVQKNKNRMLFQTKQKCYHCDKIMFEITPATFSYLDSDCRCQMCNGTGKISIIDESKIIEHPEKSLLEGASPFYGKLRSFQNSPNANWMKGQVFGLADSMQVDLEKPWNELPKEYKECLLHGSDQEVTFSYVNKKNGRNGEITRRVEGICNIIERLMEDNSATGVLKKYIKEDMCTACNGERLSMEGRIATINGLRYPEAAKMSFQEITDFCKDLRQNLSEEEYEKIRYSVNSLIETANAAVKLGIGYLELSQETRTLSGGEGQRLKLLGAFKNHISGILYIFDEPSKGLHPKDYQKIIGLMKSIIQEGNTIIMVEHNEDMIQIADYIIEIGPGAGEKGGMLVGEGTLQAMLNHSATQICRYMNHDIEKNTCLYEVKNKEAQYDFFTVQNMNYNNLKNISVQIPQNALTCICGVSGSGKSSLMRKELFTRFKGNKKFTDVMMVEQTEIGKTSKSIVATYMGIMDFIRSEFANTGIARQKGWDEGYFSFNNQLGQCETCKGEGKIKVKFTEDVTVQCPDCGGRRYKRKIFEVLYHELNINQVLELSITQAISFFEESEQTMKVLKSLQKVGLGYLKLGQGTSTLSGGEASRLKLAKELVLKTNTNILYLLDEPTTGLHFSDVENLLKLIDELIRGGNTVIAIEHNKRFVKHCDWRIELGPGAGKEGGNIIYQGKNVKW